MKSSTRWSVRSASTTLVSVAVVHQPAVVEDAIVANSPTTALLDHQDHLDNPELLVMMELPESPERLEMLDRETPLVPKANASNVQLGLLDQPALMDLQALVDQMENQEKLAMLERMDNLDLLARPEMLDPMDLQEGLETLARQDNQELDAPREVLAMPELAVAELALEITRSEQLRRPVELVPLEFHSDPVNVVNTAERPQLGEVKLPVVDNVLDRLDLKDPLDHQDLLANLDHKEVASLLLVLAELVLVLVTD